MDIALFSGSEKFVTVFNFVLNVIIHCLILQMYKILFKFNIYFLEALFTQRDMLHLMGEEWWRKSQSLVLPLRFGYSR